ncbi:hypothetical protein DRW03_32185 [Corallococcus sp. H22C18031201]|nr:hypothetical protein DRW03_32185 [Corallococcus sp. H22C18031201]
MSDPYSVLGVARGATHDELRRAYRKLALETHPDRDPSPGAALRFSAVREAYKTLTSPQSASVETIQHIKCPAEHRKSVIIAQQTATRRVQARADSEFFDSLRHRVSNLGGTLKFTTPGWCRK